MSTGATHTWNFTGSATISDCPVSLRTRATHRQIEEELVST